MSITTELLSQLDARLGSSSVRADEEKHMDGIRARYGYVVNGNPNSKSDDPLIKLSLADLEDRYRAAQSVWAAEPKGSRERADAEVALNIATTDMDRRQVRKDNLEKELHIKTPLFLRGLLSEYLHSENEGKVVKKKKELANAEKRADESAAVVAKKWQDKFHFKKNGQRKILRHFPNGCDFNTLSRSANGMVVAQDFEGQTVETSVDYDVHVVARQNSAVA